MYQLNPEYKSTVFAMLFHDKENLKSLCEAVSGEKIESADDIIINTLCDEEGVESGVFTKLKNDVSFIFHGYQNFYEHQSTWPANMPIRMLLYYADLLKKSYPRKLLYRPSSVSLDTPRFIVFYNGTDHPGFGDQGILKLSSLYLQKDIPENCSLELNVLVYNINEGHNPDLMKACDTMKQYSQFVAMSREALRGLTEESAKKRAIESTLDRCLEQDILTDFIKENREVIVMRYIWEFDEQAYKEAMRDEEHMNTMFSLVQDGDLTLKRAAERENLSPEEFERQMRAAGYRIPASVS